MEIMKDLKALLEIKGDVVKNGEQECKAWHLTHKNCQGCPYELGCSKQVAIGLAILASNEYNSDKIQEIADKLLAAKTVKEVRDVRIPEMMYYR